MEVEGDMEARRTIGRRKAGARRPAPGPAALAMAAAGALGGIALARRRRAVRADEPLEAGWLPQVGEETGAQELAHAAPGRTAP
jgi:hypothetical protein